MSVASNNRKFVELGEHKWELPPMPERHEILYSDQAKNDQYWRRIEVPEKLLKYKAGITMEYSDRTRMSDNGDYLESLSYEDTLKLIQFREDDLKRRANGVWFMNRGEPVYLTGGNYFQLQWGAMPGYENPYTGLNYGEYRPFQTHTHYFMQMVKQDPYCSGGYIGKPKKTGITNLIAIDFVEEATRYVEKIFGIMSKSFDDARDTDFMYFLYCFDKLPDVFKPAVANRTQSLLKLGVPVPKRTGGKRKEGSEVIKKRQEIGFDSQIFVSATKADGFDGPKMFRGLVDEFTKLDDDVSPEEVWKKTKETVKLGRRVIGKLWYSAYVPETDGKSFLEAKDVWEKSSLSTRDETTKTTHSGLYKYFIPAEYSYESDASGKTFDRYGNTDIEHSRSIIMAERAKVAHNPNDLQAFKRQYPLYEYEMWEQGGGGTTAFDNVRLGIQERELRDYIKTGQLPYEMGNFEWKDRTKSVKGGQYGADKGFGLVEWVPLTADEIKAGVTAPFLWNGRDFMNADTFNLPVRNAIKNSRGFLQPADASPYGVGVDPTDYAEATMVKEGSKDAIVVGMANDEALNVSIGKNVSNRPFILYLHRHDNPDDFLEDLIKVILFVGGPVYVEGNKKWLFTALKKHGLQYFVLMRNEERVLELFDERKKQTTTDTVTAGKINTVMDLVVLIKKYLKRPEGADTFDNIKNIWFLELVQQLMRFNPKNTKREDLVMALGFWLEAMEYIYGMRLLKSTKRSSIDFHTANKIFRTVTDKDIPVVFTDGPKDTI